VPSDDDATDDQFMTGALVAAIQVAPEFVEIQIEPVFATAASLFPSDEDATALQIAKGAEFDTQVAPEFVEV